MEKRKGKDKLVAIKWNDEQSRSHTLKW